METVRRCSCSTINTDYYIYKLKNILLIEWSWWNQDSIESNDCARVISIQRACRTPLDDQTLVFEWYELANIVSRTLLDDIGLQEKFVLSQSKHIENTKASFRYTTHRFKALNDQTSLSLNTEWFRWKRNSIEVLGYTEYIEINHWVWSSRYTTHTTRHSMIDPSMSEWSELERIVSRTLSGDTGLSSL